MSTKKFDAGLLCHNCNTKPSKLIDFDRMRFCSQQCLNDYKMWLFRQETELCLQIAAQSAAPSAVTKPQQLITPTAWTSDLAGQLKPKDCVMPKCGTRVKEEMTCIPTKHADLGMATVTVRKSHKQRRSTAARPHPYYALNKKYWQNMRRSITTDRPASQLLTGAQRTMPSSRVVCVVDDSSQASAMHDKIVTMSPTRKAASLSPAVVETQPSAAPLPHNMLTNSSGSGQVFPACCPPSVLLVPYPFLVPVPIPIPIPLPLRGVDTKNGKKRQNFSIDKLLVAAESQQQQTTKKDDVDLD